MLHVSQTSRQFRAVGRRVIHKKPPAQVCDWVSVDPLSMGHPTCLWFRAGLRSYVVRYCGHSVVCVCVVLYRGHIAWEGGGWYLARASSEGEPSPHSSPTSLLLPARVPRPSPRMSPNWTGLQEYRCQARSNAAPDTRARHATRQAQPNLAALRLTDTQLHFPSKPTTTSTSILFLLLLLFYLCVGPHS